MQVINQIKNVVGVRIRVSGRDEYIEGTRDRSVTISGPKKGVAIAEQLVRGKLCVFVQPRASEGSCQHLMSSVGAKALLRCHWSRNMLDHL